MTGKDIDPRLCSCRHDEDAHCGPIQRDPNGGARGYYQPCKNCECLRWDNTGAIPEESKTD